MLQKCFIWLLLAISAQAAPLRIDFDLAGTEPGWESLSVSDTAAGDSWSKIFTGGIGLDVDAAGAIILDTRDRGSVNGGPETSMWADFLFANGSTTTSEGLDLQLTGLMPDTDYPITIWAYDTSSGGARRSTWNGVAYEFNGANDAPSSLAENAVHFTNSTDAAGSLLIEARSGVPPGSTHNVFINGMEIGDPVITFVDTDNDLLDDNWERLYFTNITFATGSDQSDADTLDNLAEQARGTHPLRADTDADGLNDDLENDSGIFNGPGDPGTDPLLADTDGDLINDGDELSLANGFVTHPLLVDTDGDGALDGREILLGFDPTDFISAPVRPALVIHELLAINTSGLADGFGNREDWIELYNPHTNAISLAGFYLSDNPNLATKWRFPSGVIGPQDTFLVFASGRNTNEVDGTLHTSFKLDGGGEYLALIHPDGQTIEDVFAPTLPEQFPDISYGRRLSDDSLRYFDPPTPDSPNGTGFTDVVGDTRFNFDRGFYTNTIQVVVTSETATATIRYTLDGSLPDATTGLIYTGPITIASNTTLRAGAFQDDWLATDIDTQTYLFIDQVVQQAATPPPGWPSDWGYDSQVDGGDGAGPGIVFADYEMDPRVVTNTLPGYSVEEALLDIPTISIVMNLDDFVGPVNGIWTHPKSRVERICSVEWINPDGAAGFQVDAEIEMHGNSSRNPWRMNKHSMRLTFKAELGTGKLEYPVIPDYPVQSFNKLVLRACFTDSWGLVSWGVGRYRPNDSQYIRDVWMKKCMSDMGHPSSFGTFAHVYVNGIYFGLFNPAERLDENWCADHLGGLETDYDVMGDFDTTVAGSDNHWDDMFVLAASGLTSTGNYAAIQSYLDLDNFSDYMLLHFYADAEDWPSHNGYAFRNRVKNEPFRWLVWDQEIVLDNYRIQRYDHDNNKSPARLFQGLRANPTFRQLFADRVYKQCYNGGPLSIPESQERYARIADRIDKAIVAESARWGDTQMKTPYGNTIPLPADPNDPDDLFYPMPPHGPDFYFTREDAWLIERDNVIQNYIPSIFDPSNPNNFIAELRAENLYPDIDPPVFNQHGGPVDVAFTLSMTSPVGTVMYTQDGSDPSEAGAQTYTSPLTLTNNPTTVKARVWDGTEWSALAEASFTLADLPTTANLVISEIHYNPMGSDEAEFIELLNIGTRTVTLEGLQVSNAVDFVCGAELLAPGERIVIVENREIFTNTYPLAQARIAGQWSGRLDNLGDRIFLVSPTAILADIQYLPGAPWPTEADGSGHSLEYLGGPPEAAASWKESCAPVPTPGASRGFCPALSIIGGQTLQFEALEGETYRIEYRDHLLSGDWITLDTIVADEAVESLPISSTLRRYFRVVWMQN